MKKSLSLSVLAVVLVLGACDQAPDQKLESVSVEPTSLLVVVAPDTEVAQKSEESRHKAMAASMRVFAEISGVLKSDRSLAEKNRTAQELLKDHSGPEWYFLEQMVSLELLPQLLDAKEKNPEAIGYYTRLLAKNENPSAPLLSKALMTLRGHWASEEISKVAHQSTEAAMSWLAEACPDCDVGGVNEEVILQLKQGREGRFRAVQKAIGDLAQLADREIKD
ncbi:hypothetical protein [Rhodocaloribacter sp.]